MPTRQQGWINTDAVDPDSYLTICSNLAVRNSWRLSWHHTGAYSQTERLEIEMTSQVAGTYNLIGFGPREQPIQERRASGVHVDDPLRARGRSGAITWAGPTTVGTAVGGFHRCAQRQTAAAVGRCNRQLERIVQNAGGVSLRRVPKADDMRAVNRTPTEARAHPAEQRLKSDRRVACGRKETFVERGSEGAVDRCGEVVTSWDDNRHGVPKRSCRSPGRADSRALDRGRARHRSGHADICRGAQARCFCGNADRKR